MVGRGGGRRGDGDARPGVLGEGGRAVDEDVRAEAARVKACVIRGGRGQGGAEVAGAGEAEEVEGILCPGIPKAASASSERRLKKGVGASGSTGGRWG